MGSVGRAVRPNLRAIALALSYSRASHSSAAADDDVDDADAMRRSGPRISSSSRA